MKTLYLHIGTPKTGTTAIQQFCCENQEVLKEKGYYYPIFSYVYRNANYWRNAHFLYGRMKGTDGKRDVMAEQKAYQEAMKQIRQAFKTYDNVILSDEGLWNCGFRDGSLAWKRIKDELAKGLFEVKVIVYLRPQEDFLYSWWSQRIKEYRKREDQLRWKEVVKELPTIKLDYYNMLQNISEYVGKENIIVRIFERSRFEGGSIHSDFLNVVGLTYTTEYQFESEVRNESLTKNNTEIKRILNLVPDMEIGYQKWFRNVLMENSKKTREKDIYSMFSENELEEFRQQFREGNRKIAAEYIGVQEELFPLKSRHIEKWTPEKNYMLEDVVSFFGQTVIQMDKAIKGQQKQLEQQQRQLKEQQKQLDNLRSGRQHPVKIIKNKVKSAVKSKVNAD